MAADIFSRNVNTLNGVFAADNATMSFGGGVPTTLVQTVQFNYSQAITRLYEVGQPFIYYVGGRTQGQAGINRVLGPGRLMQEFYKTFGNVCNARQNVITVNMNSVDCAPAGSGAGVGGQQQNGASVYVMKFCVLTAVGVSVQASDMIFNEASQVMFSSLESEAK